MIYEDCKEDSKPDVNTVKNLLNMVYDNAGNTVQKYMVLHELEQMINELRKSTSKDS